MLDVAVNAPVLGSKSSALASVTPRQGKKSKPPATSTSPSLSTVAL
jgi:hypothetical protein